MVSMAFLITVLLTRDQALFSFRFLRELLKQGLISGSASYTSDPLTPHVIMRRCAEELWGTRGEGGGRDIGVDIDFDWYPSCPITKEQCLDQLSQTLIILKWTFQHL